MAVDARSGLRPAIAEAPRTRYRFPDPNPDPTTPNMHFAPTVRSTRIARIALRLALAVGITAAVTAATPIAAAAQDTRRLSVEIEAGPVWQSRNDVQIPNDASGTRFSLQSLTGSGPWPAARLYLSWRINERHELRVLAAPLTLTETATLTTPVDFAGASYEAGRRTEATYTFNSYRLTWRYRFHEGTAWTWWIGFTAKIRDADIELRQGSTRSAKTDLGFVPLLHLAADRRLSPDWRIRLDADALAGGPGRAEDVSLKIAYDVGPWTLAAGYRTVEGGADVDAVYTFAWLHYAVLSAAIRF
jgi:hypothetical protein